MQNETKLVGYNVIGARRTFVGELVSHEGTKLVMSKILVIEPVPTQGATKSNPQYELAIYALEYASRDSIVHFDTSTLPGFLVYGLDYDMEQMYNSKISSAYSKLSLV